MFCPARLTYSVRFNKYNNICFHKDSQVKIVSRCFLLRCRWLLLLLWYILLCSCTVTQWAGSLACWYLTSYETRKCIRGKLSSCSSTVMLLRCSACWLWQEALSLLLMQVYWQVTKETQNECIRKATYEVCNHFKAANTEFYSEGEKFNIQSLCTSGQCLCLCISKPFKWEPGHLFCWQLHRKFMSSSLTCGSSTQIQTGNASPVSPEGNML